MNQSAYCYEWRHRKHIYTNTFCITAPQFACYILLENIGESTWKVVSSFITYLKHLFFRVSSNLENLENLEMSENLKEGPKIQGKSETFDSASQEAVGIFQLYYIVDQGSYIFFSFFRL